MKKSTGEQTSLRDVAPAERHSDVDTCAETRESRVLLLLSYNYTHNFFFDGNERNINIAMYNYFV